jgi:hypothetical protein
LFGVLGGGDGAKGRRARSGDGGADRFAAGNANTREVVDGDGFKGIGTN